jgi:hypothetical protein
MNSDFSLPDVSLNAIRALIRMHDDEEMADWEFANAIKAEFEALDNWISNKGGSLPLDWRMNI